MLHTVYRFCRAGLSYLLVLSVFVAWAGLAWLCRAPEAGLVAIIFAAIFFAPGAFINKWDDIGD